MSITSDPCVRPMEFARANRPTGVFEFCFDPDNTGLDDDTRRENTVHQTDIRAHKLNDKNAGIENEMEGSFGRENEYQAMRQACVRINRRESPISMLQSPAFQMQKKNSPRTKET